MCPEPYHYGDSYPSVQALFNATQTNYRYDDHDKEIGFAFEIVEN